MRSTFPLHLLGEIAARGGPTEAALAERHYRAALVLATELAMRPLVAHCHLGLGALLSRSAGPGERVVGDDGSREHLARAAAMFSAMGMSHWRRQAEATG